MSEERQIDIMYQDLYDTFWSYEDKVSFAEAVGALAILQQSVIEGQKVEEDE